MHECIIVGHRGASGLAPENTLLSFKTAIEIGVAMVELDVHQTNDGHLVCIHDYEVDRTTNGRGAVAEMSLKEIQELDAGKGERIPLLSEVLDLARGRVKVNIELKVTDVEKNVIQLVKDRRMVDAVIVSSFLHGTLSEIREISKEIKTAVLLSQSQEDIIEYVMNLEANALNPLYSIVCSELVTKAHKNQILIYPWTVNDPVLMIHLLKLGVDGIITDYPDIASKTMKNLPH